MDIHTTTRTIPEIEISHTYTVFGATILVSRDRADTPIVTNNALIGILRLDSFFVKAGPFPSFESDQSIRDDAYNPEFATDKTAVMIIKFMKSAAYGMPTLSSTTTNGLSTAPAVCHGRSAARTAIDKTKKTIVLQIIFRIDRGNVFQGFHSHLLRSLQVLFLGRRN